MNRKRMVPFIVLLLMLPLIPSVLAREATTLTSITIDGDVHEAAPNYTRDAGSDDVYCYWNTQYRGFVEWDVSSIPDAAIIDSVQVRFRSYSANYDGAMRMYEMANQPSAQADNNAGNQVIYDDAGDGDIYVTTPAGTTNTWYTVTLSAAAITDLTANLALDWFAIGTRIASGGADSIYSSETAYDAELIISWHLATDYEFYFLDAIYENNTDAGSITVTAVLPSGAEDFTVDGPTWWYSPEMPTYFTWEVSAGIYRRIYVDGEENFTITLPEDSFTSFGFTIKDFTGESSTGNLQFETRRIIGGSERIIERIPVVQTINLITCTLVANRNYMIQFTVGATTYRYTFFSSTVDTTPTIVLNTISFSRTIQISSKYVYVDADRPTTTSLRVNYTNSRADTNSVQIRIREMDGTLINSTAIGTDTFTYTYSPVDNETSYYFDLIIDTDTFSHLTWRKTLPWEPTFSNVPDPFTLLGTVGALDTSRIFGFMIILFTALLFSAKDVSIGCFSIALTTSLMNYWGFFTVPLPILAVVIGLSVLIGLGLRGR